MKMPQILTVVALLFCSVSWSYEPEALDPVLDAEFIPTLGFSDPYSSDRFNLLLVGYDSPTVPGQRASRRYALDARGNRRKALTSRSDVMMVISFDRANRVIDILSVNRDMSPRGGCWQHAANLGVVEKNYKGDRKVNGAPILYGRKTMIACQSNLLGEFIQKNPELGNFGLVNGNLPIHALYEAQRGTDADSSVVGKLKGALWDNLYNLSGVYWDAKWTIADVGTRYKVIFNGLKRRNYPAGSYQRAFNNAKFVADALGWVAPGVQSTEEQGYDFIATDMFIGVQQILGTSMTLQELNVHLSYFDGENDLAQDNMFRYGAFLENPGTGNPTKTNPFGPTDAVSPVRVIQVGVNTSSYAIYHQGVLDVANSRNKGDAFLPKLKVRPVFQLPGQSLQLCPECWVEPAIEGQWGTPAVNSNQN